MVFSESSGNCYGRIILYTAGVAVGGIAIGYLIGRKFSKKDGRCNYLVKLDIDKVADTVDIEDLGERTAFCRCWKSKEWPYCDKAHRAHNVETGDNVGPLYIERKSTK